MYKCISLFGLAVLSLISGCGIGSTYRVMNPDCNSKHGFCYRAPDASELPPVEIRGDGDMIKELEPVVYDMLGIPGKYSPGIVTGCRKDIVSHVAKNGPEGLVYTCVDIRWIQEKCKLQVFNVLKLAEKDKELSNHTNDYAGEQVRRVLYSNAFLQEYAIKVIKEGLRRAQASRTALIIGYYDSQGRAAIKTIVH